MRKHRLDDRTADRLITGAVTSADAPPGYAGVADLLHTAGSVPTPGESAHEAATVASMRSVILEHPVPLSNSRRNSMLSKALTAKAAGAAAVAILMGGGVAAAATDSLPTGAQNTASSVLSHVGISVPNSNGKSNGHGHGHGKGNGNSASSKSGSLSTGPNSHALFGLCTAEAAHKAAGVTPNSSVFPSAATCAGVVHPGSTTNTDTTKGSSSGTTNGTTNPGKPSSPGSNGTSHKPSSPGNSADSHGSGHSSVTTGTSEDSVTTGSSVHSGGLGTPGAVHSASHTGG